MSIRNVWFGLVLLGLALLLIDVVAVKHGPRMNGRRFRSGSGCCICAKKSQPSRPFFFARDPHELRDVFGMYGRTGDLCSACHSKVVHHRKQTKVKTYYSLSYCNLINCSLLLP